VKAAGPGEMMYRPERQTNGGRAVMLADGLVDVQRGISDEDGSAATDG